MPLPSPTPLSAYGGALGNYLGQGVVDPTTDLDAAAHNQAMSDLAAMTNTTVRAWCVFTSTASPALVSHYAMWGTGGGVAPVVARTSAGVYTVTWPSTITDALGASQSVTYSVAEATAQGSSAFLVQASKTSSTVATVYAFTTGGVAADSGANVMVKLY
jgi:hypothetical protein